jgi:hypothetical protein
VIDTNPPQISIVAPQDGSTHTQPSVNVNGLLDEPADVTVNGISLGTVLSFNTSIILQQGTNIVTVSATDTSGNIATEAINIFIDSRAPNPVDISKLTATIPGAGQFSFSGSAGVVEPGSDIRITNTTTGVITTAAADITTGAFNQLINADTGHIIELAVIDSAGNISAVTSYTVGASIQITTPLPNTTVAGAKVNVSGIFSGETSNGIIINSVPACVYGNSFYNNDFPLQMGSNLLTATLTDPTGTTSQHSISVTSDNNPVMTFKANTDCGSAPLDVNFDLRVLDTTVLQVDIDFDGDGTPDLSTTDANPAINTTYATPGIYTATVWVLDAQGVEYSLRTNIVVQDATVQDSLFQQIWSNFSNALAAGDINQALNSIKGQSRGFYEPVLQALAPNLPAITGDFSGIEQIQVSETFAEYAVLTVVSGQVKTFIVTFGKDSDGIWRIQSM